jgi:membrane protease YdiL (CAAX protease family)
MRPPAERRPIMLSRSTVAADDESGDMGSDLGGGPPARRRHWYSARPAPQARRISGRRAYTEVLGVFAAFFATGIIAAGESLAGRYPRPGGSWAVFIPGAVSELSMAALAALVVILLSGNRGISRRALGLDLPRLANGRPAAGQVVRIAAWAVSALAIGSLITDALATGKFPQPVRPDYSYVIYSVASSFTAAVVEEMVVLGLVISALRQARRPLPEIVIVALLLRCSYHIYYGPGVAGIAVWAAMFIWLYLRTQSLLPLIAVHFLWDLAALLGQRWHAISAVLLIGIVVLPFAGGFTWLVEISRGNSAEGGDLAAAGVKDPDPA